MTLIRGMKRWLKTLGTRLERALQASPTCACQDIQHHNYCPQVSVVSVAGTSSSIWCCFSSTVDARLVTGILGGSRWQLGSDWRHKTQPKSHPLWEDVTFRCNHQVKVGIGFCVKAVGWPLKAGLALWLIWGSGEEQYVQQGVCSNVTGNGVGG